MFLTSGFAPMITWTTPDFQEITLNMEVTAYVNTDGSVSLPAEARPSLGLAAGAPVPQPAPGRG